MNGDGGKVDLGRDTQDDLEIQASTTARNGIEDKRGGSYDKMDVMSENTVDQKFETYSQDDLTERTNSIRVSN